MRPLLGNHQEARMRIEAFQRIDGMITFLHKMMERGILYSLCRNSLGKHVQKSVKREASLKARKEAISKYTRGELLLRIIWNTNLKHVILIILCRLSSDKYTAVYM
jgi:hypothetical protein